MRACSECVYFMNEPIELIRLADEGPADGHCMMLGWDVDEYEAELCDEYDSGEEYKS